MTDDEAMAIEKVLVSKENVGPPNTGIAGAHMIEKYTTTDGRTLVYEYGNGWGKWYFDTRKK